jgi:EAL domain-containing protein (putative c-di-GMP-specific phosphodiesterase class I)
LLPDLPEHGATAAPLLSVMNRMAEPFRLEDEELTTSVSVGIAIYPDDGVDFDTLAKKADMAMYRAKEAGRNTYRFFDEQMNVEAIEQLAMRNGLRRALERGEFVLHYQPQIDLASGAVVGAEALIRWQHPELGLVAPGRFIGVAEESRLIIPIGEWVLREACRQAVAWRRAGLPALVVAVNLSAVQFRRGDVEQTVLGAIEASGHDPALLELEITESTLIENVEEVLDVVERLKRVGVRLSIDDFGTGYSSLSYLKRFHVDKLKVDQSFVRELTADANDAAIVKAIIQMGHSLNLRVIAEGVESAEALAYLRALLCDEVQGFHFARPMEPEQFAAYLVAHRAERGTRAVEA